jgi:hypothetical protein
MKPSAITPSHSKLFSRTLCGVALLLSLGLARPGWAAAPFTVNANGTVTDSSTSLVWDQCPIGLSSTTTACDTGTALTFNWPAALNQAVTANAANAGAGYKGITDWRLPNVNELQSITKIDSYSAGVPAIDSAAFPHTPVNGDAAGDGSTWTSTTYSADSSSAFRVLFSDGQVFFAAKYPNVSKYYVRLVRGGPSAAAFDLLPPPIPVNGACVTGQTLTVAPANPNLCTAGTAGLVTTNSTDYTWACLGSNGGSDAPNCSAVRNYVVTSSVTGGNGAISSSQNVAYNATPSFSLTPASGYVAGAVTGTCGGSLNANSFTTNAVTADCTVVASFSAAPVTTYLLSVSKNGTGTGTVTSDTGGINCGATCSASYASGATVTLVAAAVSNSTFTGWSGACTGTANCVVSLSAARSVVAGFALNTYAITATANPPAGGSVNCTLNPVPSGGTSTCTATPNAGYSFTTWSGDCTGPTCVLGNITATKNVVASFTATPVPTGAVAPIPTLSEWTMILLATLMAMLGLAALRRNPN